VPASHELLSSLERLVTLMGAPARDVEALRAETLRAGRLAQGERVDLWLRDVASEESPEGGPLPALLGLLRREGVARLVIRQGTPPRELAQFAGVVSRAAASDTPAAAAELDALGIWGVQLLVDAPAEGASADVPELAAAIETLAEARQGAEVAAAHERLREALALIPTRVSDRGQAAVATALAFARVEEHLRRRGRAFATDVRDAHWTHFDRALDGALGTVAEAVVARALPELQPVLQRAADRVVPLLLERLGAAEHIAERRRCVVALLDAGGGVETLIGALRDPRWYVVRNVAMVLGELGARGAVRELARCLGAPEGRVRQAAAQALERIGTAGALHALLPALRDAEAGTRLVAARAAARAPELRVAVSADQLAARLRVEPELPVALELVTTLRAFGDPEALGALALVAAEARLTPHGAAVQGAAWEALAAGDRGPVRAALRQLAREGAPPVRGAARRVLVLLDGAAPDARSA
jgi:HEAT repeat protein